MAPPDNQDTTTTTTTNNNKRRRLLQEAAPIISSSSATTNNNNPDANPPLQPFPLGLAKGFESAELKLMEATPEILAALSQGQTLRLVGESRDQSAALVTEDATFELCRVETSNLLLLVPALDEGVTTGQAVGTASFHFELKRSKPKQQVLRKLLLEDKGRVWTMEELEVHVQGSPAEILALLHQMNALEVAAGQGWRAVNEETEVSPTLDRLLTELISAGMDLDAVPEEKCLTMLADVDPLLVQHCLKIYGTPAVCQPQGQDERDAAAAAATWKLDLAKVARFKAHQIFRQGMDRPQKDVWTRDTFFLEWEARLPGSYRPEAGLLCGIALTERVGGEACLRYLPAETLPLDPVERLQHLFQARKRWTLDDLKVYMLDVVPSASFSDFLLKNARSSTVEGGGNGRMYSAK